MYFNFHMNRKPGTPFINSSTQHCQQSSQKWWRLVSSCKFSPRARLEVDWPPCSPALWDRPNQLMASQWQPCVRLSVAQTRVAGSRWKDSFHHRGSVGHRCECYSGTSTQSRLKVKREHFHHRGSVGHRCECYCGRLKMKREHFHKSQFHHQGSVGHHWECYSSRLKLRWKENTFTTEEVLDSVGHCCECYSGTGRLKQAR